MAGKAMTWSAAGGFDHREMKLCKDEHSEELVFGIISPALQSAFQDVLPVARKRRHQMVINQRDYVADDDDLCDELACNASEKKRRLTVEQMNYLETSFNMDLKLEPERKALIAKHLGLRPRQVAIWFQNRRARWKNKQLEHCYEALKAAHNAIMQENETMVKQNEAIEEENKRLQAEVVRLKMMLENRKIPDNINTRETSPELDSDSDSESALKVGEQPSNNSQLASPTKSDAQSETLDSLEGSCPTSQEAAVAFVDQPIGEINSIVACAVKFEADYSAVKVEADYRLLPPPDEVFVNFPQIVNGFFVDDLLFGYEDHLVGFTWGS